MIKNLVLYHAHCPDGAMAAAVAFRALQGNVTLLPASYQKSLDDVIQHDVASDLSKDALIYVLDFSFSPKDTDVLSRMVPDGKVVILDHHKSAMERYKGTSVAEDGDYVLNLNVHLSDKRVFKVWTPPSNVGLVLDMDHSGAALAWAYFHPGEKVPSLIAHVEDYDLWRHTLPDSKAVHAYLRSFDMDVPTYVKFLDEQASYDRGTRWMDGDHVHNVSPLDEWISEGRAILRANEQQARALANKPEIVTFSGLTALAVNAPLHQDDIGSNLAAQCKSGVGVLWYWRGGRYKVSLRSRSVDGGEPFDCSAIAKQYGGGGHRGAASFVCDELPWKAAS